MAFFQSAFWFLILIGVMILIHELGHFWAARFFDVRVDTFSFGFGPRLFGFRRGETDYRVSLVFFLGGFVKMAGELPGDESANDPRGFLAKPRWQRLIIVLGGPLMNVVLAVGLLTGLYMVKYQKVVDADSGAVIGSGRTQYARGQGRHPGRRPHREAGQQAQSDLGRHHPKRSRERLAPHAA
jgi:regulator of sigma E protease